jgi:hypothetical protein
MSGSVRYGSRATNQWSGGKTMLHTEDKFTAGGWYLFPGPVAPTDEPIHTVELHDLIEYDYPVVAEAILSVPGTRCTHPANPDWSHWRARWASGAAWIEVDMMPGDTHLMASDGSERNIWSGGE